jgi:hypothetical protein
VLSHDEVRALVQRCGLGDHEQLVMDLPRAAWRLDPDQGASPAAPGTSKVGGGPDLAEGEQWPVNPLGVPYVFLAQIDCAGLPELGDEWPPSAAWQHGGKLIRVFADCAHVDGVEVIVLEAPPETTVSRRQRPPMPAPWPFRDGPQDFGLGQNAVVPEAAMRATPCLTAPQPGGEARGVMALVAYREWASRLTNAGRSWEREASTLLGEPVAVHASPLETVAFWFEEDSSFAQASDPDRSLTDPGAWRVLLHLATDERLGFQYGGGMYTVVAPAAELAAGRYDHALCLQQY